MRGLAAIPPPMVEHYQKELQANNVPPGQEAQYFMSKRTPLDPNLLFLIQQNRAQDSMRPPQAPVMSSVLQDKIAQAMQQAQAQPLPPPAAMQQMAMARQAQMQQAQQGQGMPPMMAAQGAQSGAGIAPLPFNSQGYARGGIVAFAGDDEETGQLVEGDDEGGDTDTQAKTKSDSGALDQKTAQGLLEMAQKNAERDFLKESQAAAVPMQKLDKAEMARRGRVAAELDKQEKRARQQAVFNALTEMGGHRTAALGLQAVGRSLGEELPKIDQLYRNAREQAAQGAYQMQRADLLLQQGQVAQAAKLKDQALKQLTDAQKALAAAKRADAAANKPGAATAPGNQLIQEKLSLMRQLRTLDPDSDEAKKVKSYVADIDKIIDKHPEWMAPTVVAAQTQADARKFAATASAEARKYAADIQAKIKAGDIRGAKSILDSQMKLLQEKRTQAIFSDDSAALAKIEKDIAYLDLAYKALMPQSGGTAAPGTAPAAPGTAPAAPGTAPIVINW